MRCEWVCPTRATVAIFCWSHFGLQHGQKTDGYLEIISTSSTRLVFLGIYLCAMSCYWFLSLSVVPMATGRLSSSYPVSHSRESLFIIYIHSICSIPLEDTSTGTTRSVFLLLARTIEYECFACTDANPPYTFLVTTEARRRHWIHGVTDGSELPCGSWNQIHVFCKTNKCS